MPFPRLFGEPAVWVTEATSYLLMAGIILSISSLIPQNSIPGYFNPIELHKTIVNCVCLTKKRTLLPIRDSFKTKQIDKPATIPF